MVFVAKMFFRVLNQTVEDLFHRPAIGAATVLVMELVDEIEKKAMLLVDVLNPDAILVSPAQKSHCFSRSSDPGLGRGQCVKVLHDCLEYVILRQESRVSCWDTLATRSRSPADCPLSTPPQKKKRAPRGRPKGRVH
jgi:hypothetical protein